MPRAPGRVALMMAIEAPPKWYAARMASCTTRRSRRSSSSPGAKASVAIDASVVGTAPKVRVSVNVAAVVSAVAAAA